MIPACVTATLDIRHADDAIRHAALQTLLAFAAEKARERKVELEVNISLEQHAVAMDPRLSTMLERAAQSSGETPLRMVSGAGHDAMILARRIPAAMLFLRSPNGLSHHPDETVLPSDVAAALAASLRFLRLLSEDKTSRLTQSG